MKIFIEKDNKRTLITKVEGKCTYHDYGHEDSDRVFLDITTYPKGTENDTFVAKSTYEFCQDRGDETNNFMLNCISDNNYLALQRYKNYEVRHSHSLGGILIRELP